MYESTFIRLIRELLAAQTKTQFNHRGSATRLREEGEGQLAF
jgi:hypothetical protein